MSRLGKAPRSVVMFLVLAALSATSRAGDPGVAKNRKPASAAPTALNCGGSEPFWGLKLTPQSTTLTLAGQESDPTRFSAPSARSAEGMDAGFLVVYGLTTITTKKQASLTVLQQKCGDESGAEHPYTAIYASPAHVLYGCCSL